MEQRKIREKGYTDFKNRIEINAKGPYAKERTIEYRHTTNLLCWEGL